MTNNSSLPEIELASNFEKATTYSKLKLLSDCIKDINNDADNIKSFIHTVNNEISVATDKIQSYLAGNAKRLELLKELNQKLCVLDYKRKCYVEEYMELVPLKFIKERYDSNIMYNNK